MNALQKVDPATTLFDIGRDLSISTRTPQAGPPQRIDGITLGIITMTENAPHNGEVHPDGDELLYIISGRVSVRAESAPDQPLQLQAGDACIVYKNEWHKVDVLEKTQLLYLTPGPRGDHRPLPVADHG